VELSFYFYFARIYFRAEHFARNITRGISALLCIFIRYKISLTFFMNAYT